MECNRCNKSVSPSPISMFTLERLRSQDATSKSHQKKALDRESADLASQTQTQAWECGLCCMVVCSACKEKDLKATGG